MKGRRVALATYAQLPHLAPDDRPLVPALAALGIAAEPVVWDNAAAGWNRFDAVVVRSCWDYHLRVGRFLDWLAAVESQAVPVVKPAVSASAHATWRTSRLAAETDENRFRALVAAGDVLVQPLVREVAEAGEWSLICFGGEASHAVLKRPAAGDWRVQGELGGTAEIREVPALLLESADRVLAAARAEGSTYARVDGCLVDGRFVLMELELIEPQLYLGLEPHAAGRFAKAIAAALP